MISPTQAKIAADRQDGMLLPEGVQQDFCLPQGSYLLSHSVGRPLRRASEVFARQFFTPWQQGEAEPWPDWLTVITGFRQALARLFYDDAEHFCPQVNLSSALSKILLSHPRLARRPHILLSEQDFPSMGFVMQQAPEHAQLRFIPRNADITDVNVWLDQFTAQTDLLFISQVYSNTGQRAPVAQLVAEARARGIITVVDVAQSAGVIPLDLSVTDADFVIGSCVKWLCGGPGAGFLWGNPAMLPQCTPRDVGWFSHAEPFEFDIHHFVAEQNALKFWGGTPSIAPFVLAADSIAYMARLGDKVYQHNQTLLDKLHSLVGEYLISPMARDKRSGTAVIHTLDDQRLLTLLQQAGMSVDLRAAGVRVSPHIYTREAEIDKLAWLLAKVKHC
ncbi:class V aminotransferase [Shewanella sp. NFH-SH190041]|nr:class V aminotransferase [Shewanella sp. NFH-SH190041]